MIKSIKFYNYFNYSVIYNLIVIKQGKLPRQFKKQQQSMSSKIKQQEYFLWQSMIPQLRKNIDQCIKQIKQKPIFTSPPQDIEMKINKIKWIFEEDNAFDEQEFLDVFAYFIEEKVNITLLELADLFSATFGKDNAFWTQKITHWANMNTFTNSLVIWNVTQFLRNFINYSSSPLERDFIYQWRQKVHAYLSSLEFLVRKIQKLKRTDNPYSVDDSYIKYHKEKMLYMTFVNKFGIKNNNDDSKISYHDEVTITFQNKARAQKKLFNFPHATRTIDDMQNYASKQRFPPRKSGNTLQKYNFRKQNFFPVEQYEDQNDEKQRMSKNRQELIQNLSMIGKTSKKQVNELRDELMNIHRLHGQQLKRQRQKQQAILLQHEHIYYQVLQQQSMDSPDLFRHFPMSHAVFIHNPYDYYSLEGHPIGNRNIPVSNPFVLYHWINYYINDREQYEEFMAVSLNDVSLESNTDSEEELEQQDEQSKKDDDSYFIDKRTIITPDNVEWQKLAPEDRMKFDQIITQDRIRWIASSKFHDSSELLSKFTCLDIYGTQLPYMIIKQQNSTKSKKKGLGQKEKSQDPLGKIIENIYVINQNAAEEDNSNGIKKIFPNEQTMYHCSHMRDVINNDNIQI